jgi:hypothetical protein
MDDTTYIGGEEPQKKKRSRVKWFSFIFAGALIFLGIKIHLFLRSYSPGADNVDPVKLAAQLSAVALVSRLALGLGGLTLVVGIAASIVRSPWVKLLEMVEGLAFVACGGFLLFMRGSDRAAGLFDSPIFPAVLVFIGLITAIVAFREHRKLVAAAVKKG